MLILITAFGMLSGAFAGSGRAGRAHAAYKVGAPHTAALLLPCPGCCHSTTLAYSSQTLLLLAPLEGGV